MQPTEGKICCDNLEISGMGAEYRKLLGYLPQEFGFYPDFTAERFLRYMAALKALPKDDAEKRIEELLTMVELKNVRRKKLKTFSGGMLRRIGIAQTLLNNPEILVLDEPTAGLDPKERVRYALLHRRLPVQTYDPCHVFQLFVWQSLRMSLSDHTESAAKSATLPV